jgi:hypothetical protein
MLKAMRAGAGFAGAAQQGGRAASAEEDERGLAGFAQKEFFSCRKNWLFPRAPMSGGLLYLKKVR